MTRIATKHHRRAITVLAVAALVAPIAGGCATPPASASRPTSGHATGAMPDLLEKDITHWVMPTDQFTSPTLPELPNYALNRQMETCMTRDGFNWPIPVEPTDDAS